MFLTHTFAHRETLSRAYTWLIRLGFHPRELIAPSVHVPRLMIPVEPDRLAAAQMLINAVESADADGFPSFWNKVETYGPNSGEVRVDKASGHHGKPNVTEIGWHPID